MVFDTVKVGFVGILDIQVAINFFGQRKMKGKKKKMIQDSRLPTQWVIGTPRQFSVNRTNLLGDMGKGLVEKIGSLVHDRVKVILGFASVLSRLIKALLSVAQSILHALKTFHDTRIRSYLVKLAADGPDLFL